MVMPDTFYKGTNWQQESEPQINIDVLESDLWPVDTRSGSGTKDQIDIGLHPILAIGGRTVANGRPLNLTGVLVDMISPVTLGTATDRAIMNIARGYAVRQYVANVLTYDAGSAATFETAPIPFQPVYVDDSDDLSEGVTCSLSPLNDADVANPLAGWLYYAQDEIADGQGGGARATSTFDGTLANSLVEQEYCVMLAGGGRDA